MTYNHSAYIEDALNGFVMQQTDFPYVCLVMDDASTDGEQDVIRAFLGRECDMDDADCYEIDEANIIIARHKGNHNCTFAVCFLKQNLFGTSKKKQLVNEWRSCCKYEALCEGDDYWTDPLKLQKQVDFLDGHEECVLCYTDCDIFYEVSNTWERSIFANGCDLLKAKSIFGPRNGWYCANMTWVYRMDALKKIPNNPGFIDGALFLLYSMCLLGDLGFVGGSTGVYRRHLGSASCIVNHEKQYEYDKNTFMLALSFIPSFDNCNENLKRLFSSNLLSLYVEALKHSDQEIIGCFKSYYKDTLDIDMICGQYIMCHSAKNSQAYRLGKFLLKPFSQIRRLVIKMKP